MTTVAYDGTTLASDSQITAGSRRAGVAQKVFHVKGTILGEVLYGFAGDASNLLGFLNYLLGLEEKPPEGTYDAIVIVKDLDEVRLYDDGIKYTLLQAPQALGSGAEYAISALCMGYDSIEAVELAMTLDVFSAGPVQHVSFADDKEDNV